jgi:hypothetical protein
MAPKPATYGSDLSLSWEQFRRLAVERVKEGNALAGERLWEVVDPGTGPGRLVIRSTACPSNLADCRIDLRTRVLLCRNESSSQRTALKFHFVPGSPHPLRAGGREFTINEALSEVLDRLVWADEGRLSTELGA